MPLFGSLCTHLIIMVDLDNKRSNVKNKSHIHSFIMQIVTLYENDWINSGNVSFPLGERFSVNSCGFFTYVQRR